MAPDRNSSALTVNMSLASRSILIDISNVCEAKFDVKPVRLNSPIQI